LASLEPRLPKIVFRLPEGGRDMSLFVDGVQLGAAALDAPQPIDPGAHTIRASATARQDFSATVKLDEREAREIVIPSLTLAARSPRPNWVERPEPAPEASHGGAAQRILGGATGAVGAAGLVSGLVFGVLALDANSTADSLCPGNNPCANSAGVSASERAHSFGTVATVSLVAGAALVVVGGVLFFTAHSSR
jgi:hypothetical protein